MSEDHLSTLFFIEMLKERLEKSERTPPAFVASLGAGVQPRSTVQLVMPVSDVEKRHVFAVFPRLWGVIWRGKAFGDQQC